MYGKGPDYGTKGNGQWMQYDWDFPQYHMHGAKGQGKGKGKNFSKGKGNEGLAVAAVIPPDKKDRKIKELEAKLERLAAKTSGVLQKGTDILNNGDSKDSKEPIVCPTCGTEHHNHAKLRCRNRNCRSILQPDTAPRLPQVVKAPRHPLLSGAFQALLQDAGAVECLEENLVPKASKTPAKTEAPPDEDEDMEGDHTEGAREKAEQMLEKLKQMQADASVIRAQEKLVEGLPKPKKAKYTQPILDVGRLHHALSQATEFHQALAVKYQISVQRCEQVLQEAQQALEDTKALAAEHKGKAAREIKEINDLISKKQAESGALLPTPQQQQAATQELPADRDQQLLQADFQNWLVNASCPEHLQIYIQNMEMRPRANVATPPPPTDPTQQAPTMGKAGANMGGEHVKA